MEEDKQIAMRLIAKGIHEYKIIRTISTYLQYRVYFGKITVTNMVESRALVLFKSNGGISHFEFSGRQSDNMLDKMIDLCQRNSSGGLKYWMGGEIKTKNFRKNSKCMYLDEFNKTCYAEKLEQEINKIAEELRLSLNIVYTVELKKNILLRSNGEWEQYTSNCELICVENKEFKKNAIIRNNYSISSIKELLIKKLNKPILQYKEVNLNSIQKILIKAEGVAYLLNTYVLAFYANYIYTRQSFLKLENIGEVIIDSKVSLISLPNNGIVFDGEGIKTTEKVIVESGKLINILSNSTFSEYLGIDSLGDTSLENKNGIEHQRLVLKICESNKRKGCESDLEIYYFKYLRMDFENNQINGVAIGKSIEGESCFPITFDVRKMFKQIYLNYDDLSFSWIDNVYCSDIIMIKR